jgi:hypothetical protein
LLCDEVVGDYILEIYESQLNYTGEEEAYLIKSIKEENKKKDEEIKRIKDENKKKDEEIRMKDEEIKRIKEENQKKKGSQEQQEPKSSFSFSSFPQQIPPQEQILYPQQDQKGYYFIINNILFVKSFLLFLFIQR